MIYKIPLGHGKFATVDKEDVLFLSAWKWYLSGYGYAMRKEKINSKYKMILMHRVILERKLGHSDFENTDHVNQNRIDNRKDNLRPVTHSQNCYKQLNNTSGYIGVSLDKRREKWQAEIGANGKDIYLGQFDSKIMAARARDLATIKYHGEHAVLNFKKERLPMIQFLSPTSISLFQRDIPGFYKKYVLRTPREPQTKPMASGSAFDAYIKSYLYARIIGKKDSRFDLETIFESQVEEQNRDWAWAAGEHIFREYQEAGCLQDLLIELGTAISEPSFEFKVQETIEGVPLLGLPDCFFISKAGARVILDWKINGYCSTATKSPAKGYIRLRPGHKIHKDCHLLEFKGILINAAMMLEDVNKSWADQLSIYSWLMGSAVGSTDTVYCIDQACGPKEKLRFASHRLRISADYQQDFMTLIQQIWKQIQDDHYFLDLSGQESRERCSKLSNTSEFDFMYNEPNPWF